LSSKCAASKRLGHAHNGPNLLLVNYANLLLNRQQRSGCTTRDHRGLHYYAQRKIEGHSSTDTLVQESKLAQKIALRSQAMCSKFE
jgi:hypothetical protein